MLLGSHNSLSYLPPKKWWMKPFHWMARCQRVDYKKQYALGVRVFDLRIWLDKCYRVQIRHGQMEFKVPKGFDGEQYVAKFLRYLDTQGGCAVRVILEEDDILEQLPYADKAEEYFHDWCIVYAFRYKHIKFFGGNRKYDWKVLYDFKNDISLDDKYSSTTSLFKTNKWPWLRYVDDLWPWLYARLHNKENLKKGTDKECLFVDFVDMQ